MYRSRHTSGLNIDQGARIISKGVEMLKKESELWHHWAKLEINNSVVLNMTESMLGLQDYTKTRSTAFNYITDKYKNHYSKSMGRTFWALYNAFTDWSTHAPTKGNKDNVAMMRQKKVQQVLAKFPTAASF